MKIDLTTVLNGRCDEIKFEYDLEEKDAAGEALLPDGVEIISPIHVSGKVTDKNGCMFLYADISLLYRTFCDRCLEELERTLEMSIERMISTDAASNIADEFDLDDPSEEILYVNDSGVDIDSSLKEEIALALPIYHLCSEDCPGLCPKCGKKLSDGPCGCENKKEIDPRLKKLQKLLDNFD